MVFHYIKAPPNSSISCSPLLKSIQKAEGICKEIPSAFSLYFLIFYYTDASLSAGLLVSATLLSKAAPLIPVGFENMCSAYYDID